MKFSDNEDHLAQTEQNARDGELQDAPSNDSKKHQNRSRGRPFPSGVSGNLDGRPRGSRNQKSLLAEQLLEDNAEAIIKKLVERALENDKVALALVAKYVLPLRRSRSVSIELPKITNISEAARAAEMVLEEASRGEITPDEATTFINLITTIVNIQNSDLALRIDELEKKFEAATRRTKE